MSMLTIYLYSKERSVNVASNYVHSHYCHIIVKTQVFIAINKLRVKPIAMIIKYLHTVPCCQIPMHISDRVKVFHSTTNIITHLDQC